jgi:hypothetical protein
LKEDRALGPAGRSPGQSRRAAWVSSSIPSKCGNPRRQRISSRIHTLWPNVASLMRFAIYLWRNPRNASVFPIMPVSRMGLILKPVSFAAPWPCAKVPRLTSLVEDRGEHRKLFIATAGFGPDGWAVRLEGADRRFIRLARGGLSEGDRGHIRRRWAN